MEEIKEEYNLYRGRLKNSNIEKLIWYDDKNTVKLLYNSDDFVINIKKGDEYLIDILKERNDLEFLELWKK